MRVLLVEDDAKIASFVEKGLRAAGYAVDHAADGETGLHLALTERHTAPTSASMSPGGPPSTVTIAGKLPSEPQALVTVHS